MIIKRSIMGRLGHFKGKLLFISGPRQTGKTFIIKHELQPNLTLDMDVAKDRISFKQFPDFIINWRKTMPSDHKPIVFIDEIHKVKGWRNIIKGTYDKTRDQIEYVASGSSAFNLRRQDQGDSLAGRAIWLTLFPVSFREYVTTCAPHINLLPPWKGRTKIAESIKNNLLHKDELRRLWNEYATFGSFPENLVRKDTTFYKQWLEDYLSAMLDRDLKDLHLAMDIERVYQTFQLLLEGIGSTYSLRSIAETIGVSPNTVKNDVKALKQILWGFELPVASLSKARQIRKEKKFYPIDFCFINYKEPLVDGAKFECIVASLLRRGLSSELSSIMNSIHMGFYRDYNQKEVDFVIQNKKGILLAIECKLKAKAGHGNLPYLAQYRPLESILVVEEPGIFESSGSEFIASIELIAPCLE